MAKIDLDIFSTDLSQLSRELNESINKANELKRESKELGDELDKSFGQGAKDAQEFSESLGQAEKNITTVNAEAAKSESIFSKLGGGVKAFGIAMAAAFSVTAIVNGIKALVSYQKELEKTRKLVSQLTGLTGSELNKVTALVQATAETFDKDFREVLISANTLAKEFGLSQVEALEKMQEGFIAGADASGEFLDILKEYPAQFAAAGLSADQAIGLINQSVKEGIFSDKGPDVIKEATLRLREFTPATRDALDGIGLSSQRIANELASGQASIFDIIQRVSNRLRELPEQSAAVGTAIADIFGGPGEDAGLRYISLLGEIKSDLSDVLDESNQFQETQEKLLEANIELELAMNRLFGTADGLFDSLLADAKLLVAGGINALIDGIINTINYFRELYNESLLFRALVEGFGVTITTAFELAKVPLETFLNLLRTSADLIKAVFTGDFARIPEILDESTKRSRESLINTGRKIGDAVLQGVNDIMKPKKLEPLTLDPKETEELKNEYKKAGIGAGNSYSEAIGNQIRKNEVKLLLNVRDQAKKLRKEFDAVFPNFDKEISDNIGSFIDRASLELEKIAKDNARKKAIENLSKPGDTFLAKMLGIDDETAQRVLYNAQAFTVELGNLLTQTADLRLQHAQQQVDLLNQQVEAQEEALEREIELAELGFANNVELRRKELEETKKQREQALEEERKAVEAQRRLDSIQQASSIITASANILKGFSTIPLVGQILGLAAVAAMIAGFISAQSQIRSITEPQQFFTGGLYDPENDKGGYTGTTGIRNHSGLLGRKPYNYHGQEFIFNNRKTRENRAFFEALHNDRLSDLTIADPTVNKLLSEATLNLDLPGRMRERNQIMSFSELSHELVALRRENKSFHDYMRKQGQVITRPDGSIEIRKGNLTRIIKRHV